jgi:hypothetical protein
MTINVNVHPLRLGVRECRMFIVPGKWHGSWTSSECRICNAPNKWHGPQFFSTGLKCSLPEPYLYRAQQVARLWFRK